MKLLFYSLIFLLLPFTVDAQVQLEGQVGVFQTTATDKESNRLDHPGFFAGVFTTMRLECFQATSDIKVKSTGSPEIQALAHFNMLWFLEPVNKIFEDNERQVSLLAGGGFLFSPEFYNNLELPFDMRLNLQSKKMRVQIGVQVPMLEAHYFEDNFDVFVLFTYDIPRGWNKKN